jgi:hypothetical protein
LDESVSLLYIQDTDWNEKKKICDRPLIMCQLFSWLLHFITEGWMKSIWIITLPKNSAFSCGAMFYYCEAKYLIWHLIKPGYKKKWSVQNNSLHTQKHIMVMRHSYWEKMSLGNCNGDVLQQTWWLLRTLSITFSFSKHNILEIGSVSTVKCTWVIEMISF